MRWTPGHKKGRKAFLSLWWTHVICTDYDSIVKVADYNITDVIREEFKKKFGKSIYLFIYLFGKSIFCQTGGGQRGWWKNQTVFLKKVFFRVWRTLRSGIRFSAKAGRKWMWSNGARQGVFDLFWCISITTNVKSYKKIDERAQTANFSVFTMGGCWLTGALC